jgi:hypothetical protein
MGPEGGGGVCRGLGLKAPSAAEPQPSAKEIKAREITAQCDEFADQMGWHQSDREREAAAKRCRRSPDEFLGTDPGTALHGYWLSSSILQCDPGYIAEDEDCVRLPEREGGIWTQSGGLGCDKNELYILVVDKRGVTNWRDLDDLAPEQQQCLKLREPKTSKRITSTDQVMQTMRPTVDCPNGYRYIDTIDVCALQ